MTGTGDSEPAIRTAAEFGRWLRSLRDSVGLSSRQLEKTATMNVLLTKSQISRVEGGQLPTLDWLREFLNACGVKAGTRRYRWAEGVRTRLAKDKTTRRSDKAAWSGSEPSWPACVGSVPAEASAFQPRQPLRDHVVTARRDSSAVILGHPESGAPSAGILAGGGGVGKSQLAAWFAREAITDPRTDLVVWVTADSVEQITATYARVARRVGAAVTGDVSADAQLFVEWLHDTDRTWLVVLDDITDPSATLNWWPPARPNGWTLATTRLRDAALASSGREQINVGVFTAAESASYLTDRLTELRCPQFVDDRMPELAATLGHLPLALSHAAAYMSNRQETCSRYLVRYTEGRERLTRLMPAASKPDGYVRAVAVTLLINLDAADHDSPVGMARPALTLAAMLDPAGHPAQLWETDAATRYLTQYRSPRALEPVSADQADEVLTVLNRYALIDYVRADDARAVRIHSVTARARLESLTNLAPAAVAAADALLTIWPSIDVNATELVMSLHANVSALRTAADDHLWNPTVHPLLQRAGFGLLNAQLFNGAVSYWRSMVEQAQRQLGLEHPYAVAARGNLARVYAQAGQTQEAIAVLEKAFADQQRLAGAVHPDTIAALVALSGLYGQVGRAGEAIAMMEQQLCAANPPLDPASRLSAVLRVNLGNAYAAIGRTDDAIALQEQVLAELERAEPAHEVDILMARGSLATSYGQAGRFDDAITILEPVLNMQDELIGEQHPTALQNRNNLAYYYSQVGRFAEAAVLGEKILAEGELRLGPGHPDTVTARTNVAFHYWRAGRTPEAIALFEQLAADCRTADGPNYYVSGVFRTNVAYLSGTMGRDDAVQLLSRALEEVETVLGPQHPVAALIRLDIDFIEELTDSTDGGGSHHGGGER